MKKKFISEKNMCYVCGWDARGEKNCPHKKKKVKK